MIIEGLLNVCSNQTGRHLLLNNGHVGDEHFVHCSEVVPSLGKKIGRG